MSAEDTSTPTDSRAGTMAPESVVPSSPLTDPTEAEDSKSSHDKEDDDSKANLTDSEDVEGMDSKAKALMHLLKTSSWSDIFSHLQVFVAIMSEKMKKQQEDARLAAIKHREQNAATQKKTKSPPEPARRATRTRANQDATEENKPTNEKTAGSTRGRPKRGAAANGSSISSYFKKADVEVTEDNPSVQQALEQAADDYESNPTALGEQELVATQQPKLVSGGKMRTYQLEGLEWLKTLWMNGLCGILADEMGLGKTVQAISMIAFLKENNISGPFLIAAPLSTVSNWVDEFARWTPEIKTVLYHGSKDERAALRRKHMKMKDQGDMDFPVVCTSYEICMNDRKFLGQYQWRYIVVDEGHRLKNMNCKLIKELLTYNSANRLLITGTPLQNNISELWSLLHFLLPEVFNDLNSFEGWFDFSSVLDNKGQAGLVEKRKRNLVTSMHAILKPFLLRRLKTDVETSLPKKREYILYAPLTPEQKDLYREIINGTGRQYLEGKALERLESKSGSSTRSQSMKRKRNGTDDATPVKSARSSGLSTPASNGNNSNRRRRRSTRQSYNDLSDGEFDEHLRKLELGIEEEEKKVEPSDTELEDMQRAENLKLAKKEIGQKKMQNPVLQARLACNSPHNFYWPWMDESSSVDETLVSASGKMLLLDRLVSCLLEKGHKILIFSQFKTQLDIIEEWITTLRSWECCRIDGAIAQSDRQAQIKNFNTKKSHKLFLLSTRAGGQGINLTAADTVIIFDSDWNPQQDLQAQDRAHRIGQTRPVIIYRLATKGTVEQTLLEKADSKRRLERLVIQKGKFRSLLDPSINSQDVDELRKVLGENEFERFEVGSDPTSILSNEDLDILTDRSEEAYLRAEKGLDTKGAAFVAVETKRDPGESILS
ncbi:Helicase, C-terminal [Penicillium expansum]|uniref:Helicase, C-terminal n=1 Tax=Penicillium expansum TaxID=27334 RepID=A0A0A2IU55_PENEN|nr:Helicase, C-terminal [Penicillium expansum]KGO46627.1 Helicase, C-terminal [Penicillium expansum]KGO53536.1 Helicase, C-terminal [Penicillium expansum]KGO73041.1 Helicase, C-terminal [Penicillium expansum]